MHKLEFNCREASCCYWVASGHATRICPSIFLLF